MNKEKSIAVLNTLIEINSDRIEGYKNATQDTDERDLDDLFFQLTYTSKKCKIELISEVLQLGGKPAEGIKSTSTLFRIWKDIKNVITDRNKKLILVACEYGEYIALKTYRRVLSNHLDCLNVDQQYLVNAQSILIKKDHDYVKSLCDKHLIS